MSARGRTRPDAATRVRATAGEIAWVAALPVALLSAAAILLLGPPLGDAFFRPGHTRFWPVLVPQPEPTEHARFVLSLLGPLALSAVVLAWRGRALERAGTRVAVRAAQALLLAFAAFAVVSPHFLTYTGRYGASYPPSERHVYFTGATLAFAVMFAALLALALRAPRVVERVRTAARETPARRGALFALAALFVALWMLTAFNTDGSIGRANAAAQDSVRFWLDETFAVLNGSYPLVSFHAQYAQLLPYLTGGAMRLLGANFGVYTAVMVAGTTAAMLAVYALLRRVTHSSLLALALFAPFAAMSFSKEQGTIANLYGPSNTFSLFPIRYGGPFLLAWLLARQLDGRGPRSRALLFGLAGIVLLDNPEFGGPAFVATFAALAWTLPEISPRALARLAGDALLGALGALALVALLTLTVAGGLPRLGLLVEYSRIYGAEGFGMLPMPAVGLHLALYVTFAAALVLATVRSVAHEPDRVLTGLLCWIAIFGFGAGGYYVGRSHPEVLIDVFSPWALALALLLVAAVRAILRRPARLPSAAELAVFAGFALAVCAVAQTPPPWRQVDRLRHPTAVPAFRPLAAERFVAAHTRRGERVAILFPMGHRIAYDLGLVDVVPYADLGSMVTLEQWRRVVDAMRAGHVRTLFVLHVLDWPELTAAIRAEGFRLVRRDDPQALLEYAR